MSPHSGSLPELYLILGPVHVPCADNEDVLLDVHVVHFSQDLVEDAVACVALGATPRLRDRVRLI